MLPLRMSVLAMVLTIVGVAFAQDKKPDDKPPTVKLKGRLPPYFKRLGLRDDQVQKILKIRADSKAKQDELQDKIDNLKADEKKQLEQALTPDQFKRLRELKAGDKPSDK